MFIGTILAFFPCSNKLCIVQRDDMKMLSPFFLILAVLLFLGGCRKEPAVPLALFYLEACPGCESYIEAEALAARIKALVKTRRFEGRGWNMAHSAKEANDLLMKMIEERSLPDISYALPLLFVGDDYYVGYEEIKETPLLAGRAP